MCNDSAAFLVLGGDERMLSVYEYLKNKGNSVGIYGFELHNEGKYHAKDSLEELISKADAVILPTPLTNGNNLFAPFGKDIPGIETLGKLLRDKKTCGGGKCRILSEECNYTDLLEDEWLCIRNAELTAEAAISEAITRSKRALSDCNVLITGNGRIGKHLRRLLHQYTSKLTVSARKERDRADIELSGAEFADTLHLADVIGVFDVIFSTVPALVFDHNVLEKLKTDCLLIDLASAPGSADTHAVEKFDTKYVFAKALPGRYFPLSSGEAIAKTVLRLYGGDSNA